VCGVTIVRIPEGCILLARKIKKSDIWEKPTWWYKVWTYLLMEVNHSDGKTYPRGSRRFTVEQIYDECHLVTEGIKPKTIHNCLKWLKRTTRITTRKTTLGMVISICNFDEYQNMANYKNQMENQMENQTPPVLGTKSYNKNDYNNNNDIIVNDIFDFYEQTMVTKIKRTAGRKKKIETRLKSFSIDDIKTAIRNVKGNKFMMGENDDGRKHNQIELICRSDEKLETYLNMVPKNKPGEDRKVRFVEGVSL